MPDNRRLGGSAATRLGGLLTLLSLDQELT